MSHPDPPAPRRRPTIVDVARRAGVSAAAVSFAVNDRPGVSSGTRERILAAARELGWQPSASARALTEARTRAVGLVLARDLSQLEGDAFFVRFLTGIERALTAADYALLLQIVPGETAAALPAYERLAAAGRVDGFLLTDIEVDDARFALLQAAAVPVVLAGRPSGESPFPCVETRHDEGIGPAVEHLVALGHERIAFLGGRGEYGHVREREAAWRAALAAAGLAPGPVVRADDVAGPAAAVAREASAAPAAPEATPDLAAAGAAPDDAAPGAAPDAAADRARRAALTLLRQEPTAVVCTSDALAIELIAAARAAGLAVPDDLSVVGFDDSALAAFASPALTSVRVDYAEFGEAAARALLACIEGEAPPAYAPSAPELVVRASTGRVPPRWRSGS